jgi:2-methylcitrate dehydratase PrpD
MDQILEFIHETSYGDLPPSVRAQVVGCVMDTVGALCGGRQTRLSGIIRRHAYEAFGGDQATLLLDGRRCSAPGAALANGMTIDSLDIHDSHRESLGHAGVLHVIPTVLAVAEQLKTQHDQCLSGKGFLAAIAIGYDVACRAGVVLHATVSDYHTSGAWGAVSSAALYSRLHGMTAEQTRHALGIEEYHGPRSQMMRCIDHPSMVKDGSGWGAMAGISAGMLAAKGFTGAPAVTVESAEVAGWWQDLGSRWLILEQGFKVHGVCWWAQPAIEGALSVARAGDLNLDDIAVIEVETFEKATHLCHPRPSTSEEAQYSLPYPVAAALCAWAENEEMWPGIGPKQLLDDQLNGAQVLALAERVKLVSAPDLTGQFPARFLARVRIKTTDGRVLASGETTFRGEQYHPLTENELRTKYRWLASDTLSAERMETIENLLLNMSELHDIQTLIDRLVPPPDGDLPMDITR